MSFTPLWKYFIGYLAIDNMVTSSQFRVNPITSNAIKNGLSKLAFLYKTFVIYSLLHSVTRYTVAIATCAMVTRLPHGHLATVDAWLPNVTIVRADSG